MQFESEAEAAYLTAWRQSIREGKARNAAAKRKQEPKARLQARIYKNEQLELTL